LLASTGGIVAKRFLGTLKKIKKQKPLDLQHEKGAAKDGTEKNVKKSLILSFLPPNTFSWLDLHYFRVQNSDTPLARLLKTRGFKPFA